MILCSWLRIGMLCLVALVAACQRAPSNQTPSAPSGAGIPKGVPGECKRAAADWFTRKYYGGQYTVPDGMVVVTFSVRESANGGECKVIVSGNVNEELPGGEKSIRKMMSLFNVRTNKEIGAFMEGYFSGPPDKCFVGTRSCKSLDEWEALIKSQ